MSDQGGKGNSTGKKNGQRIEDMFPSDRVDCVCTYKGLEKKEFREKQAKKDRSTKKLGAKQSGEKKKTGDKRGTKREREDARCGLCARVQKNAKVGQGKEEEDGEERKVQPVTNLRTQRIYYSGAGLSPNEYGRVKVGKTFQKGGRIETLVWDKDNNKVCWRSISSKMERRIGGGVGKGQRAKSRISTKGRLNNHCPKNRTSGKKARLGEEVPVRAN